MTTSYYIKMVSPEGCIFRDSVKFIHEIPFTITFDTAASFCDYTIDIILTFQDPIASELIEISAFDLLSDIPHTEYDLELIQNDDLIKIYRAIIPRITDTKIKAYVEVHSEEQICNTGDPCIKTAEFVAIPKSAFEDPWWVYIPNIFSPNNDGHNDLWFPSFAGCDSNCENVSSTDNNVYSARVQIFDRWGGLMFKKLVRKGIFDVVGINGEDLTWDGKFNGQYVNPGVYTCLMDIHSCYADGGVAGCTWNWDCPEPGYFCSSNNHSVTQFDITVIQ